METKQDIMDAVAIDRFGGPEELTLHELPVPEVGSGEILIRVDTAGVGVWDPFDREGGFVEILGAEPKFPYVLGADGAGIVEAVGEGVTRFVAGDRVYSFGSLDPKSRFYAKYAVVKAEHAAPVPEGLSLEEAGAMPTDALTALVGLDEILHLQPGETLLVFGASGGIGHLAVQLAKRIGARVLAVASHEDGVELVRRLGADAVVDGHGGDVGEAARTFAPEGIDAALVTAAGEGLDEAMSALRDGARVAYPHGVQPKPHARDTVHVEGYDGRVTHELLDRLNGLIEKGPFTVEVARTFPLEAAAEAHRTLDQHFLGKLALKIGARPEGGAGARSG